MLTFGSLFAGIGGFDLGLERAGMVCKWQVEIDDYANRVLAKHWPDVRRWPDVRTWPQPDTEWVDVVCGGFPCQDISYAGRGAGLAGERSGLFFEALRVVQQLRPTIVCLENVAALLTRGLDVVLGTLAQIGYDAEWHCIPAASIGAPHFRDRAFILGYGDSSRRGARPPQRRVGRQSRKQVSSARSEEIPVANIVDGDRSGHGASTIRRKRQAAPNAPGSEVSDCLLARLERGPLIDSDAKAELAAVERSNREPGGQWFAEPDVGRVANGIPNRIHRLRCLGNAVVPQVAQWVGERIVEVWQQRQMKSGDANVTTCEDAGPTR